MSEDRVLKRTHLSEKEDVTGDWGLQFVLLTAITAITSRRMK
jgi:hypothetical protein